MDAVSGIDANNQWIAYNQTCWIQVIVTANKVYKENMIDIVDQIEYGSGNGKDNTNNVKYQDQSRLPKEIWAIVIDYAIPYDDYSDETKYRNRLREIDEENKKMIENLDSRQFDQLYFQTLIGMLNILFLRLFLFFFTFEHNFYDF